MISKFHKFTGALSTMWLYGSMVALPNSWKKRFNLYLYQQLLNMKELAVLQEVKTMFLYHHLHSFISFAKWLKKSYLYFLLLTFHMINIVFLSISKQWINLTQLLSFLKKETCLQYISWNLKSCSICDKQQIKLG